MSDVLAKRTTPESRRALLRRAEKALRAGVLRGEPWAIVFVAKLKEQGVEVPGVGRSS